MKKYLLFLFSSIFFIACNDKSVNNQSDKMVWVYFEVGSEKDYISAGVYGEIAQKDLDFIKLNSTSEKLLSVEKIRFIVSDSLVKDISVNSNEEGTALYQIKKINYLEILKKDPLDTKTNFYNE